MNIKDRLIDKASKMTGIKEKTKLVRLGLEALIARESARRLAKFGATEKQLKPIPRERDPLKMVLVDTSVWVSHLQEMNTDLAALLNIILNGKRRLHLGRGQVSGWRKVWSPARRCR